LVTCTSLKQSHEADDDDDAFPPEGSLMKA
jgi:hypothetical protein